MIYLIGWFNGFSIMTSFFAEFARTDNGLSCSDSGFRDLSTEQECSGAVSYAKSFNRGARYNYVYSSIERPKGCYIWGDGAMYFNAHPTGGSSSSVASICGKGNT